MCWVDDGESLTWEGMRVRVIWGCGEISVGRNRGFVVWRGMLV